MARAGAQMSVRALTIMPAWRIITSSSVTAHSTSIMSMGGLAEGRRRRRVGGDRRREREGGRDWEGGEREHYDMVQFRV